MNSRIQREYKKTLDYLGQRYNVVLSYNHIENPTDKYKNDILYKVYIGKKDVMWVYLQSGNKEYLSVETEPEYIEGIPQPIAGFYKSITRTTRPRNKFYFSSFDAIKESLDTILSSIDNYFGVEKQIDEINDSSIELFEDINGDKKMEFDNNTILYGPPGTGKTYNTAIYAVAICDGKSIDELTDYDTVMKRYNELKKEGRIAFTTFHQSYGYEEFIEGIKPVIDGDCSDVGYTIEAGVFKKFCDRANRLEKVELDYTAMVWAVRNRAGDSDVDFDLNDYMYSNDVVMVEDITDCHRQCDILAKFKKGDWIVLGREYKIDAIGIVNDCEPEEISKGPFHWQRNVIWLAKNLAKSTSDIGKAGLCFSNFAVAKSSLKPSELDLLIKINATPFVFIIDEINRGNISKIFGELITLIENTKRAGMLEAASAILPYSGEAFSVPANIYIIGTMNTADRSIALMDTALRRRFQFVEMLPSAEVLRKIGADKVKEGNQELDVAAMLEVINERIAFLYDREHTIGHAFFTELKADPSIERLAAIFAKSVIPLLQEYFYEDYQKIQLVLGDNGKADESLKFIKDIKVVAKNVFKGNIDDVIDIPEKKYEVNEEALLNIQSYIEIM